MRRGQAAKLLDDVDYLSVIERALFLDLLERSDNADCSVPPWRSPRLPELGRRFGINPRTVRRALIHLDRHGWIAYVPGSGRGHRGRFHVAPRQPDQDPPCRPGKGDTCVPLPRDKGGHPTSEKGDTDRGQTAGQNRFVAKGLEGEQLEGPQLPELPDNVTRLRFPSLTSPAAGRRWASGFDN